VRDEGFGIDDTAGVTGVQFGVNVHGTESFSAFEDLVRRADDLGSDVFAAPGPSWCRGAVLRR
jgi:hypothetical protein